MERLRAFLGRAEVTELVVRYTAITDRWRWDKVEALLTEHCVIETHVDRVLLIRNRAPRHTNLAPSVNWRERTGVRGQQQWVNVTVSIVGDEAFVLMSGTQTNTFPDRLERELEDPAGSDVSANGRRLEDRASARELRVATRGTRLRLRAAEDVAVDPRHGTHDSPRPGNTSGVTERERCAVTTPRRRRRGAPPVRPPRCRAR